MRRFICALGQLAGASPWACAQSSSVTIYGIIDAAVERANNVGTAGASIYRMPGLTGTFPSRLGFRGTEDLGDGLRAVFVLEQGFAPDTGTLNQGARMFGRQAFVGLSDRWGTISFGRQYTMLYMSVLDADILGPNLYGSGSMDGYIANARADNPIAYRGTFGGFTVGTTFSLGRDVVAAPAGANCPGENGADSAECRGVSAMLKYDTPSWGVAAAVDELRGGAGAAGGLVASSLKDRRATLSGYVKARRRAAAPHERRQRDDAEERSVVARCGIRGCADVCARRGAVPLEVRQQQQQGDAGGSARHLQSVQAHGGVRHGGSHLERRRARAVGQRQWSGNRADGRQFPDRCCYGPAAFLLTHAGLRGS